MSALLEQESMEDWGDVLDSDMSEMMDLEKELIQLADVSAAIESFGINPAASAILQSTGLLTTTVMSSLGLESVAFCSPDDPESQMALESITGKIKDKAAQWSAKILKTFANIGKKIKDTMSGLFSRFRSNSAELKAANPKKLNSKKVGVKVPPYKTCLEIAIAIAAVVSVVVFGMKGISAIRKLPEVLPFLGKIASAISNIKWPFGKIIATVSSVTKRLVVKTPKIVGVYGGAASLAVLGWDDQAIEKVDDALEAGGHKFEISWDTVKDNAVSIVKDAGSAAAGVANATVTGYRAANVGDKYRNEPDSKANAVRGVLGAAVTGVAVAGVSVVYGLVKLIRAVIFGGFRLISGVFKILKGCIESREV